MADFDYERTFALGLIFGAIYLVRCARGMASYSLGAVVNLILTATGVTAGGNLIALTFDPDFPSQLAGSKIYIGLAGLVLILVSGEAALKHVRVTTP